MEIELKKIHMFQDFSKEELDQVKKSLREKSFEKGEILNHEGQACDRVFFVQQGKVKLCRTASSGHQQTLEVLNPCDTCACNPGSPDWKCPMMVQAETACKVWYLSRADYAQLVERNSRFSHSLNRLFAERLVRFGSLIEQMSLNDVRKRLVKFLLDMLAKNKSTATKGVLFVPFTRQDLAERIGAARETVARHISDLRKKKIIDVKPYQIVIRDQKALEKLLQ
ncbi:MAG: Crp/Fnr family transcriptional regulator [Candidatus Omnitrophica bacterium]|nr:Crp/Fnr family transcriptional regulator [Candidatus Omnitrophota bacterium]